MGYAQRTALQLRRTLDPYHCRAESTFQKRPDLARREAASTASAGWAARIVAIWRSTEECNNFVAQVDHLRLAQNQGKDASQEQQQYHNP